MENRLSLATAAGQEWVTVAEAAEALGISASGAYQMLREDTLKARKHGTTYRVDAASVDGSGSPGGSRTGSNLRLADP